MKKIGSIVVICALICNLFVEVDSVAKKKWIVVKKLGNVVVSHYTPESNTPSGSRSTSSGRVAQENHTIAVDYRSPIAKMYQKIRLTYKTKKRHRKKTVVYTVEDYGGFAKYGRDLDVFTCIFGQGIVTADAEIIRKETDKEYEIRMEKEQEKLREFRQRGIFELCYSAKVTPGKIVTDPEYISGGCVTFGGGWFDIERTQPKLNNKILVNDPWLKGLSLQVSIEDVAEEAVG